MQPTKNENIHKNQNSQPLSIKKLAGFGTLNQPTLISRKIWVTENLCNFTLDGGYLLKFSPYLLRPSLRSVTRWHFIKDHFWQHWSLRAPYVLMVPKSLTARVLVSSNNLGGTRKVKNDQFGLMRLFYDDFI